MAVDPTADGVVVEIDQRYDRDGMEISSRNLHRLEVRDGKITRVDDVLHG